jgi:hypothetical protein
VPSGAERAITLASVQAASAAKGGCHLCDGIGEMRTVLGGQGPLLRDPALASAALSATIRHAAIRACEKQILRKLGWGRAHAAHFVRVTA